MLVGIVGKPNAGKSTFFKALTLAEVAIANYPFTTIKANEGVGFVKVECVEKELNVKCQPNHGFCIKGFRFIPVKLLDVAGLVPKAYLGKGLGNKFLDDLRQADVLIHVVDASGLTNEEGKPTTNYDVTKDISFLENEIDMWLYSIIERNWSLLSRKAQSEAKPIKYIADQLSGLKITEGMIKKAIAELDLSENFWLWTKEQLLSFVRKVREISKPMVIAANKVDIEKARENLKKLKEFFPNKIIVPCSAESELILREAAREKLIEYVPGETSFKMYEEKLSEKQKKALELIEEKVLKIFNTTGVQECLNKAIFSLLNYIVVYPVENEFKFTDKNGKVLPDAFLMPKGSKAIDLAYAIHTEIGNSFVSAIDAKTKKRLSKDYELKHNDVIKIITK